jgi:hypothetical protein
MRVLVVGVMALLAAPAAASAAPSFAGRPTKVAGLALAAYDRRHRRAPLRFIQGVWIP